MFPKLCLVIISLLLDDILTPIKTKPTGLDSDQLGPATPDIAIVKVFDSA